MTAATSSDSVLGVPLDQFDGNTFVAFTDISGFKAMISEDRARAAEALDALYTSGYEVLHFHRAQDRSVSGLFVSDCGILFHSDHGTDDLQRLMELLLVLEELHRRTFSRAIQMTTSIDYGNFSYHDRLEFPGIGKQPVMGNAYIGAFADNEASTTRIYPNECRIVRAHLPPNVANYLNENRSDPRQRLRQTPAHYYFEWMRTPPEEPQRPAPARRAVAQPAKAATPRARKAKS